MAARTFRLDRELNDVLLAVNEALTNAAEFAYRGRRSGTMTMQVRYDAREDVLLVDVSDRGTGGTWTRRPIEHPRPGHPLDACARRSHHDLAHAERHARAVAVRRLRPDPREGLRGV